MSLITKQPDKLGARLMCSLAGILVGVASVAAFEYIEWIASAPF